MLPYVPAEWIKVGPSTRVKGPAYVTSLTSQNSTYLITGGDDPQVIFMTGDMRGKSHRLQDFAESKAVAVEHVEVEVDLTSVLPWSGGGYPTCSLAMTDAGVHVIATTYSRLTFDDTVVWNLATGDAEEYFEGRSVFARWRICRRAGDRLIEILAVDVQQPNEAPDRP